MSRIKHLVVALTALAALASEASAGSTTIVVVVNSANPISSMSKGQLSSIYKAKTTEFPGGATAAVVNLPPDSQIRQDFDKAVLNMSPDEVKRYWIDVKIRSGGAAPPKLSNSAAVARHIARNPNGLGYLPESEAKGLKVVARINGGSVAGP